MSEQSEPRLTADEWRRAEARRECGAYGHDWSITQTFGGVPVALHCIRACGAPTYRVTSPGESPTSPGDPL